MRFRAYKSISGCIIFHWPNQRTHDVIPNTAERTSYVCVCAVWCHSNLFICCIRMQHMRSMNNMSHSLIQWMEQLQWMWMPTLNDVERQKSSELRRTTKKIASTELNVFCGHKVFVVNFINPKNHAQTHMYTDLWPSSTPAISKRP